MENNVAVQGSSNLFNIKCNLLFFIKIKSSAIFSLSLKAKSNNFNKPELWAFMFTCSTLKDGLKDEL